MLTERQIERMLRKLRRFEDTLNPMLFKKVAGIENVLSYETTDRLYSVPEDSMCSPMNVGDIWGGE